MKRFAILVLALAVLIPLASLTQFITGSVGAAAINGAAEGWNSEEWVFYTNTFDKYTRTYIGNGYMGLQIPIEGNGWTAGRYPINSGAAESSVESYVAGVYNNPTSLMSPLGLDYMTPHLVPIPRWSGVGFNDGSNWFDHTIGQCKSYNQTLNMYDGYMSTKYVWDDNGKITDVNVTIFLSRGNPYVAAIRYSIIPHYSGQVTFMSILECLDSIDFGVSLTGLDPLSGASWISSDTMQSRVTVAEASIMEISSGTTPVITTPIARQVSQTAFVSAEDGKEIVCCKYVAVRTSIDSPNPLQDAINTVGKARGDGFDRLFSVHKSRWHDIWRTDIKVRGDGIEVQRAIHANMFYLYCSIREGQNHSIAPMGLSSNGYNGHIFWDAEFWMYPSLLMLQPDFAMSVVQYRYDKRDGAMRKAADNGYEGLMYPWESADTGDEVTPTWADTGKYEHHITADVAIAQWWYYLATGNRTWLEKFGAPIILGTAKYWASRVTYDSENDRYEINGVICADEYSGVVNNNVFTNAAAMRNIELAIKVSKMLGKDYPSNWEEIAKKMYIPFDSANQFHPEYEGYNGQKTKQADVNLLVYPIELNMGKRVIINDLNYYNERVDWAGGPAMTSSIFSIVSSHVGLRYMAYDFFKKSYEPNVKTPFNAFSEAPSNNNFCFLTGAGGSLQSLLYGFTGFRWREDRLLLNPILPPNWKSLSLVNIRWHEYCFNLSVFNDSWEIKITPLIRPDGTNGGVLNSTTVMVETRSITFNATIGHTYRVHGNSFEDVNGEKKTPQVSKHFIPEFEALSLLFILVAYCTSKFVIGRRG